MVGRLLWMFTLAMLVLAASRLSASPAERLAGAVRFATISHQDTARIDYAEFDGLLRYLRESYPGVFEALQVELISGHSLLLRWPGSDPTAGAVLFTGHLDVVPVEPGTENDWDHPPFAGVIAGGRIYGRGTLDDKLGVISLLEAAERLLREGYIPRRTLVFGFGHDEEIGGNEGAARIAERLRDLGLHFDWMVDEGGLLVSDHPLLPDRPVALVNVAEKGYLTLTLVATGEGGHSSNPPKVSTIGRLSNALARLEANPFPPRLVPPVQAMFEGMAPYLPLTQRLVFDNLWLTGRLVAWQMSRERLTLPFVRTTTALTIFNAGVKDNVVPQRAEAQVNFRLLPGDSQESVLEHVREVIGDPEIEIVANPWSNIPPVASHTAPGFRVIRDAVTAVYPRAVVAPSLLAATTDTRHYIDLADDQYRFHGVLVESAQAKSVHGTNEYLSVESFNRSIDVAVGMLRGASR